MTKNIQEIRDITEAVENPTLEIFKKNKTYIGVIEKTIFGGKGIITIEGFKVLIKNGIEGQKIKYLVTKKKKKYAEGRIEEIIQHSPLEIHQSEQKNMLPGCAYQNISYDNQLNIKHKQLQEIFRNFENISIPEIKPSPKHFEYRNKMEFSIGYETMKREIVDGKKIWTDEGVAIGFHPAGSWSEVVSIDDVFIASESVNILRREIEEYFKETNCLKKAPWNPLISKGFWRGLIFRESKSTGNIIVNFITSGHKTAMFWQNIVNLIKTIALPDGSKVSGILETVNESKSDAIKYPKISLLWGTDILEEKLEDTKFEISPFSFFQTNSQGAEVLYSTIAEKLGDTKGKKVLDLFCGTGSIGIFCSKNADEIIGVEMVEEAVEMAEKNAEKNNITNTTFITGKVEDVLPEILKNNSFDTVIIDPPRSGMHPKALKYILDLPVKQLVYISCNPSTLARDVQALEEAGWKLKEIQGVDMFPHTPHMEVVSVIEKI